METPKASYFFSTPESEFKSFPLGDILFNYFYRTYTDIFLFFPFEKDNRRERCESKLVNLHQCLVSDSVAPQPRVLYTVGCRAHKDFPGGIEQGLSESNSPLLAAQLFFSLIEPPENLPCWLSSSTRSPCRPSPLARFAERFA